MLEGSCLCGAVRWSFDGVPGTATICNCSACRRYGALWAYDFEGERVHVSGPTKAFLRNADSILGFHFCTECGCIAYWRATRLLEEERTRIAVNLRLSAPERAARIPLRTFDGLDTFKDLPVDGRCVVDVWS